jgi:hypothetical protein
MADFVQTMKDWHRMCKTFTTYDEKSCCEGCPIMALEIDEHGCDAIFSEWADKADWEEVEDVIETWAAEHPEPVYPTWGQYFRRYYGLEYCKGHEMLFEHIPADIAEKLGIEPKEGI